MTSIQWTDVTDNPIVAADGGWWCRKVSPGCANCYAEKLNHNSFFKGNHLPYAGQQPKLILKEDLIKSWAKMRSPKKHFVCSMTDLFGEWVPIEWQFAILDAAVAAPNQTIQLLTKRPAIALAVIQKYCQQNNLAELPPNIWVGTSVEDLKRVDERIPIINEVPAKVRFLSVEPLLEPVDLMLDVYRNINWVIVGGESGKNARSCLIEWIEYVVSDCTYNKVPVFVKQLGFNSNINLIDKKGGNFTEFPQSVKFRQFPII